MGIGVLIEGRPGIGKARRLWRLSKGTACRGCTQPPQKGDNRPIGSSVPVTLIGNQVWVIHVPSFMGDIRVTVWLL